MTTDSAYSAFRRLSIPDQASSDAITLSRRRFLQAVSLGVAVPVAMGTLFDDVALASVGNDPLRAGEGILVLVGMYGGNDGMNTVVPYASADYARRRANLALANTLDLDGRVGLHPSLTAIKDMYDAGQVAVVQNVGIPNPDFSHFTSMATWMRGETGVVSGTGWLGRWLDGHNDDVFSAVSVGSSIPLHLIGRSARGTAVGYRGSMFGTSTNPAYRRHFAALRGFAGSGVGGWHDAIASAIALELDVADVVSGIPQPAAGTAEIVAKMTMAARLVNADIGCRVVDVSWGGFDTHANELTDHGARMTEFDAAVAAFYATLDPSLSDRVTVMTWSEFGRTFSSTASGGTDHGSVNPLFVIGRNVKGGVYGDTPSLAGVSDRPQPAIDFRSVYTSVLDSWMGGGAASIVGGSYSNLGLFRAGPGSGPAQTPERPVTIDPLGSYVAIVPQRVYDSRNGIGGGRRVPVGPGERVTIPISGVGAIPSSGVISVVLNATVTAATSDSYITVWPTGRAQPSTSNLNPRPGRTVPNMVVVPLGADGTVSLFNERGNGHVIIDAVGYCTQTSIDRLVALSPSRILDTRTGVGAATGKLGAASVIDLKVTGVGGVPSDGVSSVVLNVTATSPDRESYLTLWPSGSERPNASSLNMMPGQTVPNLVFATVGAQGKVSIFNAAGTTHVIADVLGYFGPNGRDRFASVQPYRVLDTRSGLGAWGPVTRRPVSLSVPGLPANATALLLNVTATDITNDTYVTVWPSAERQPDTSNLNVRSGETVANSVLCKLGSDGGIQLANAFGSAHLIADVIGYFMP